MNDLVMYLYGISTGMIIVGTLLYAKHLLMTWFNHGWAGSPPTMRQAMKAKVTKKPDYYNEQEMYWNGYIKANPFKENEYIKRPN